ncbi:MAG: NAD(P)/FAD-dependent oxidoreductase [Candidatus Methanoperedens sp.]|nr:NAD(P)/FAD-dependent oxidoreductase [Candidatus Methanoperedens sp.]
MKYDVAVIGAGPTGAIASKYAAWNGARTLLIEEHSSIGSPVQCTGLISKAALTQCEVGEGSFVLSRMKGAFVYAPNGDELTIRGKDVMAYVIDRKIFDRELVERSLDAGAELMLKTRFMGLHSGGISVLSSGVRKDIQADIIIGADGIMSSVGRAAGLPRCKKFLSGIQFEGPYKARDPEFVEIFTGNKFAPGFFGWAVPFGGMARIGLAKNMGDKSALHYLNELIKHPVLASRYRESRTELVVGGIPLGPPERTVTDNVMLAGDAAGQVKPTSGGGVYMGAVCAKIAGEVAARASRKETGIEEYEKRWRSAVGRELALGMVIHKSLGKLTDENLNEFIEFLNRPGMSERITEYGDMDHPSVLLKELLRGADKMRLVKLLGVAFKTLF